MMSKEIKHYTTNQRGATLVVALILLLVMTLMASTSLQSNVLQSRMAANMQDETIAFEAAETALLYSEEWLSKQSRMPELVHYNDWHKTSSEFVFDSTKDSLLRDQLESVNSVKNWESRSKLTTYLNIAAVQPERVHEQPRVTVELMRYSPDNKKVKGSYMNSSGSALFRQLSRNTGATGESEVMLDSGYRKRFEY